MEAEAAKLLGAGLAMVGAIGPGVGVGIVGLGAMQALARNPDVRGPLLTNMILVVAFAEAISIYCLIVAIILAMVI